MDCPDGGRCTHECRDGTCWRVRTCVPLTISGWDDWPSEIVAQYGRDDDVPRIEDALVFGAD